MKKEDKTKFEREIEEVEKELQEQQMRDMAFLKNSWIESGKRPSWLCPAYSFSGRGQKRRQGRERGRCILATGMKVKDLRP